MSFEFLSVGGGPAVARSPMERQALAAGARLEVRDGWSVAADYGAPEAEREALRRAVGWADRSHLGKLELQAPGPELGRVLSEAAGEPPPGPGRALRAAGAWWCGVTAERALVLCEPPALAWLRGRLEEAAGAGGGSADLADVTTQDAALELAGPAARETLARFCALDLRPRATPEGGFRPGSVARTSGHVLRTGADRFLVLFGWALAEYMWTVVADAATDLGGRPVGHDSLHEPEVPEPGVAAHA